MTDASYVEPNLETSLSSGARCLPYRRGRASPYTRWVCTCPIYYIRSQLGNSTASIEAAVLPLLAAKQRCREKKDWIWTDGEIACPDPNCPTKMKVIRIGVRSFHHGETTVVPLTGQGGESEI
jgi:uncharacterized repeat protein (TIGR04076 family)